MLRIYLIIAAFPFTLFVFLLIGYTIREWIINTRNKVQETTAADDRYYVNQHGEICEYTEGEIELDHFKKVNQ